MTIPYDGDDAVNRKKKLEYESRKASSISTAKSLIEKQKKLGLLSQDKSLVEESELRLHDSSDEENEDYDSKEYHLLEDVIEFKKKDLGTSILNNSNLYRS